MEQEIWQSLLEKMKAEIENSGYEMVDCTFKKEYNIDTLTVFIYKKGGVTLDDCEAVSVKLDPILDETDFCEGNYNFNVSSPGLDRPIVSMDDYRRNEGEEVEILFKNPIGKKKSSHGILVAYTETTFTLLNKQGKEEIYEKINASVVRPYIHF